MLARRVLPFDFVVRERVIAAIARAAEQSFTVILAPAGFGKTIAIEQYLQRLAASDPRTRIVRYDLRSEHQSFRGFVRGLCEALAAAGVAREVLDAFPEWSRGAHSVRQAVQWLAEFVRREHNVMLVLDDFHAVADARDFAGGSASPDICSFLTQLSDLFGRWIVASRRNVEALPVAPPLDQETLAFSFEEAAAFAQAAGAQNLRQAFERSRGWPLGLAFALAFPDEGATVYRDFMERIYRDLSEDEQKFARDTCVFPFVDIDLLNEIPHYQRRAATLVDRLRSAGVSLRPIDAHGHAFVYHDQFREFLEDELRRRPAQSASDPFFAAARSAGTILELAAKGHAAERARARQYALALQCYSRAHSREDVLRVLKRAGHALIECGYGDAVEGVLGLFTMHDMRAETALLTLHAAISSTLGFEDVEYDYRQAIELEVDPDQAAWNRVRYAEALLGARDADAIEVLRPLLAANHVRHDPVLGVRAYGMLAVAHAHLQEAEEAYRFIGEAQRLLLEGALPEHHRVRFEAQRVLVDGACGKLEAAAGTARAVVEAARKLGLYQVVGICHEAERIDAYENDRMREALACLDAEIDTSRRIGASRRSVILLHVKFAIFAEFGEDAAMSAVRAEIARECAGKPAADQRDFAYGCALEAAWKGEFAAAHTLLGSTPGALATASRRALRCALLAMYGAAAGRHERALEHAHDALRELDEAERRESAPWRGAARGRAEKARLVTALACIGLARFAQARDLVCAVERNEEQLSERQRALLAYARARLAPSAAARAEETTRAITRLEAHGYGGYARMFAALPAVKITENSPLRLLSNAEMHLLTLAARHHEDLTVEQLASMVQKGANTVKTQFAAIRAKLGVKTKREAIDLARGHGVG